MIDSLLNDSPLVSIVVPVYNTEKCLPGCISSIVSQTYTNIEILLIDDGSTDNSSAICKNSMKSDNRVFYYRQSNHGVSSARNLGIKAANGDFIAFVDSDDVVDPDFIQQLVLLAKRHGTKMSACNTNRAKRALAASSTYSCESVITAEQAINRFGTCPIGFTTVLYSSSIIKGKDQISFDESLHIAEDTLFFVECLLQAGSIAVTPKILYNIEEREGSATRSDYYPKLLTGIIAYDRIIDLVRPLGIQSVNRIRCLIVSFASSVRLLLRKEGRGKYSVQEDLILQKTVWKHLFVYLKANYVANRAKIKALFSCFAPQLLLSAKKLKQ